MYIKTLYQKLCLKLILFSSPKAIKQKSFVANFVLGQNKKLTCSIWWTLYPNWSMAHNNSLSSCSLACIIYTVYAHDWIWLVGGRYGVLLPTRSSYNWFFLPALKKVTSAWPHRHTWAQTVTRHCPFTLDIQSVLRIMIYTNVGAMRYTPFEAGVAINNEKGKVRFCLLWHVCKAEVNFWEDVNAALV